jgi:two-component system, NarL family, nitrate/nitrite response regulator NarL
VHVIRVFIVARVRLYREGLATMLPRRDGIAVVGTAESWETGADDVRRLSPDIVLIDMALADGSNAIREVVAGTDGVKVVALAVPEGEREVIAYAEAGVSGYVTREQSLDDVVAAVESAARGQVACSPRVAAALLHRVTALSNAGPGGDSRLTQRESQIATLLDEGLSNKEIAQRLCIERTTVKNHVHNILEKLEVRSRFEVAQRAGVRSDRRPSPVQ